MPTTSVPRRGRSRSHISQRAGTACLSLHSDGGAHGHVRSQNERRLCRIWH